MEYLLYGDSLKVCEGELGYPHIRQDCLQVSREHSTVIIIKYLVNYLEVFPKDKVPYAL